MADKGSGRRWAEAFASLTSLQMLLLMRHLWGPHLRNDCSKNLPDQCDGRSPGEPFSAAAHVNAAGPQPTLIQREASLSKHTVPRLTSDFQKSLVSI